MVLCYELIQILFPTVDLSHLLLLQLLIIYLVGETICEFFIFFYFLFFNFKINYFLILKFNKSKLNIFTNNEINNIKYVN